ncbi:MULTISPECIES: NAD-dependent epimerase/dehydratase family protein [unclassified Adlercreutzia]|uniref:NAD-dependent epimerase/dehydratase family protein n=1 Tax=unclassified Adlercreutzia TaxID=2636013 RepID=UPI0013EB93FD|nr:MULTISPECIES: NAD-dependent epimerase/dehydratase family protein [unclassified Adlercreutzia]
MRVLLLGGTGAIGRNLARSLSEAGHEVVVTSRRARSSNRSNLSYIQGNARETRFLEGLLTRGWDAVVDFMVWPVGDFMSKADLFLESTRQYVFISTYRVYDDASVIAESSPRLLDSSNDEGFLATDDYALEKARCENVLFSQASRAWTIVRPSIAYDESGRFDLGVLASSVWLWRALQGIPVPFPEEMLDRRATMTWGGDVALMIERILGKERSLGEAYTAATASHISWREVAEEYQRAIPFDLEICPLDVFEKAKGDIYQIRYDRMFDRIIDNSKVLEAADLRQEDLVDPKKGLASAVSGFLESGAGMQPRYGDNARMDRLTGGVPSIPPLIRSHVGVNGLARYVVRRLPALDRCGR